MLSKSLILLGVLTSTVTPASENEGAARLGTPAVSSRSTAGTASTRTAIVRSHADLLRANPWARGGSQVGYARIGASKPAVAKINPQRPRRNHAQLQTTNAWAKPRPVVRPAPPVSTIATRKTIDRSVANTPKTRVASKQSTAAKSPGITASQNRLRTTPNTRVGSAAIKPASIATGTTQQSPDRLTRPAKPPEFLRDLDALLARDSRAASRAPASPVGQPKPIGPTPSASRIYATQETVFESITRTTAFDSKEVDANVPTDRATALFASGTVPAAYHASTQGNARPLNRNISEFQHNPLYFEERNLERCGNGYGCATTAVSAARFAGTTLALPILLLGEYPSDCVPAGPDCPTCAELFVD